MDPCKSLRAIGCLLVALAGLPVLTTLLGGDPVLLAALAASLLSASYVGYLAASPRLGGLYYLLALAAIVSGVYEVGDLRVPLALAYTASVVAVLATGRVAPGLASMALALPGSYTLGGAEYLRLYAMMAVMASGLVAYELSRRGHSMMLVAASPFTLIVDPLMAAAASATSLILGFAASSISERSVCPFTIDSGMTFVGVAVSLVAAVWGLVAGFEEASMPFILWIIGFIFIEAGVLVPARVFQARTS